MELLGVGSRVNHPDHGAGVVVPQGAPGDQREWPGPCRQGR